MPLYTIFAIFFNDTDIIIATLLHLPYLTFWEKRLEVTAIACQMLETKLALILLSNSGVDAQPLSRKLSIIGTALSPLVSQTSIICDRNRKLIYY